MTPIILTPVLENEIPALQKLALATWEPTYGCILSQEQIRFMYDEIYSDEALLKQMENGQRFFFILEAAETIGFLSLTCTNPEEGRFKLNKLYLLPEMHGRGFGRQAIEGAENIVKKLHGKVLELNVNRHNKSKDFYEHCGYKITREEDIPIGEYFMNDYVMEKALA
jgi:ribosomal protein S18 acetylase RimI-like enzyme